MLQQFHWDVRVSDANAKQDRIEITVEGISVYGDFDELDRFVAALTCDPVMATHFVNSLGEVDKRLLYFRHPQGNNPNRSTLHIREGIWISGEPRLTSLVNGKLFAYRRASPNVTTRGVLSLRGVLYINPTRFVAYQRMPSRSLLARAPSAWHLGDPTLYESRPAYHGDEISLESADNVILAQVRQSFSRPDAWRYHVRRYFSAVDFGLHRALQLAARQASVDLSPDISYRLSSIETYWEFSAPSAISLTDELVPRYQQISHQSARYRPREEHDQNSTGIRVALTRGRVVRMYSKTQKRVRFEIDFDKHGLRRTLPSVRITRLEALTELVTSVSAYAADRMNEIFAVAHVVSDNDRLTIGSMLDQIRNSSPDADVAWTMLQLLRRSGRIDTRSQPSLRLAANALRRKGVLIRAMRRSHILTIHPDWRRALQKLGGR